MYYTKYSLSLRLWLVVNFDTKLAHSSWDNRLDALCTARDLNHKAGIDLKTKVDRALGLVCT